MVVWIISWIIVWYDLAEWCCMAELTRLSLENGSAPVAVPDFTRGGWNKVSKFRHAFVQ